MSDHIGTTIALNGTLTSVTLAEPPDHTGSSPGYWFSLIDRLNDGTEVQVFNVQTDTVAVPTGTVFPLYSRPFTNLVLRSISPGAKWVVTTNP
jgi:hypothetical protein